MVDDRLLVIKNVPVRVCNLCDEAYVSPDTSRHIDDIMREHCARTPKLRPIRAFKIDLSESV